MSGPAIVGDRRAVILDARTACWIDAQLGHRRTALLGVDDVVYRSLLAVHEVALAERERRCGTTPAPAAERPSGSLSTGRAAARLGITDRGVRLAIARGKLRAEKVGRSWQISREDCEQYRTRRVA